MGESGEDYWQRQFREADERAALLQQATVPEIIDIYHASEQDFELGTMCFQALQRRPHEPLLNAAIVELQSHRRERRAFAASLIDLATETDSERSANVPLLMAMLKDPDS